jgi:hypothetical protein
MYILLFLNLVQFYYCDRTNDIGLLLVYCTGAIPHMKFMSIKGYVLPFC